MRGDILHNILLGILKYVMEWIEGFLKKHKRLRVFDKIWENISPYTRHQPPPKQYRQKTMWNGTEMRGVNRVILACFTAALRQAGATPKLSAATHRDSKIAIHCVCTITDFCLMAQYRSHTSQTIGYMGKYLRQLNQFGYIFGEFRAGKADRKDAAKAAQEIEGDHARQATIYQYFQLTSTQRAKRSGEDREER